jgi:hypothetical protein
MLLEWCFVAQVHRGHAPPYSKWPDSYVPAGATLIHVANAADIHPGDTFEITKPVTPQWLHFMGMDHLVRNGKPRSGRKVISVCCARLRLLKETR